MAAETAEAARDGDALAALVFSGRVLGSGDGGRRGLFQRLAVRRRAARQHSVDARRGVSLSHLCNWLISSELGTVSYATPMEHVCEACGVCGTYAPHAGRWAVRLSVVRPW